MLNLNGVSPVSGVRLACWHCEYEVVLCHTGSPSTPAREQDLRLGTILILFLRSSSPAFQNLERWDVKVSEPMEAFMGSKCAVSSAEGSVVMVKMAPRSWIVLANHASKTFLQGASVASLYLNSHEILLCIAEQWLSQSISPRPKPSPLSSSLLGWYIAELFIHARECLVVGSITRNEQGVRRGKRPAACWELELELELGGAAHAACAGLKVSVSDDGRVSIGGGGGGGGGTLNEAGFLLYRNYLLADGSGICDSSSSFTFTAFAPPARRRPSAR